MSLDPVWFAVEQVRRVLESLGWKIISEDHSTDVVHLMIEKAKSEITLK